MTMRRAVTLIVATLATAAGAARAQQPATADTSNTMLRVQLANVRRVTLREALEDARQNAPAMVQAQQNIRVSDMSRMQAWGAYLPSISGSGSDGAMPIATAMGTASGFPLPAMPARKSVGT